MLQGSLVKTITTDGIELQGFWIDKKSEIAVFHSHGTAGDFYTHKFIEVEGEKLSREGISFLTVNNRGHDVYADLRKHKQGKIEWTQIGGGFEKFEDCVFDIKAWIDFLLKQGVKKIILQGHSLGPNKNVFYQFKKANPNIIAQIHLSPCNDAGLMKSILGEKKYLKVNKTVEEKIKSGKGKELLSKDLSVVCPMSALTYFGYLTEQGMGNTFPYHNRSSLKWRMLAKIKEPQLVIFGEDDVYIKPSIKEAASIFMEKSALSKKTSVKIIKNADHSFVGNEKELSDIIFKWIIKNFL